MLYEMEKALVKIFHLLRLWACLLLKKYSQLEFNQKYEIVLTLSEEASGGCESVWCDRSFYMLTCGARREC